MAKQSGIMPLEGSLGNYTFFKSKDGFMVRTRSGISAERIATDPGFQRTRENNAEFGRAGKAAKTLRVGLRNSIIKAKDGRMVSRLTTQMLKVVQADATSERGERNVIDGEATLLEGFDFNLSAKLTATLFASYEVTFSRQAGETIIHIGPFTPLNMIVAPAGTTHFQLFAAASSINFEQEIHDTDSVSSAEIPYNNQETAGLELNMSVGASSTHPVFILLGIEFMQQVNGKMYPLKNGAFNACSLIKVDSPV